MPISKKLNKSRNQQTKQTPASYTVSKALDEAPLSIFHIRAFLTAGMGFFTDAYDLFIIGIAITIIRDQWHLSTSQVGLLGSATLLATLGGAFVFGRLADVLGRKKIYGLEAIIMASAAIASAFSPNFVWLIIFRLILGLGIGGDYPVSGVIMSEYANRENRGQLVSLVFSMQALGLITGPIVALTLLSLGISHDLAWRLMLGLGALPALSVIYLRRTLPESPRFVAEVRGDIQKAAVIIKAYSKGIVQASKTAEPKTRIKFKTFLKSRRNMTVLFATAASWFLLDYAYYGNTISAPLIFKSVAPHATLLQSIAWNLVIFTVAAAPGYVAAFLTIDKIGHKRLQWIGFLVMGLAFAAISLIPGVIHAIVPFLLLYGISYFFTEFGPNVTTFVIPTEVFHTSARATGHGISAGIGKIGAFIGVFIFPILTANLGLNGTLILSAGFAFIGVFITQMLPEPAKKSLDDVSEEQLFTETTAPYLAVQPVMQELIPPRKTKRRNKRDT